MLNRVSRCRLLGWAACCGLGLVAGCENPSRQADRQVEAILDQITPRDTLAQKQGFYDKAVLAFNGSASPIEQAIVLDASAKNHEQVALSLIDQINHKRGAADKLISDIGDLVTDIRGEETILDKWTATDPSRALAKLDSDKQRAVGPEAVWFPHDQDPIPTAAKAQADITRLTAAIDDTNSHAQALAKQHDDIVAQADQIERQSEGETGQSAVADFKKASDLRKQAADVSVEIDKAHASLVPLTQDLGVANSQLQIVRSAIANMEAISTQMSSSWADLQSRMQATQQRIKDYDSGNAPSVESLTADLVKQLDDIKQKRKDAEVELQKAIAQLNMAQAQAVIARRSLPTPANGSTDLVPTQAAAKFHVDLNSPESLYIDQADCQRLLGDLYAGEAEDLAAREHLQVTAAPVYAYKHVMLKLPPGLDESLEQQRKDAVAAADDMYTKADQTLDKPSGATTPRDMTALKNLAISRKIFLQVDWAILEPDPDAGHLSKAHDALTRLQGASAKDVPMYLPAVVAPVVELPPAAPTQSPATTPSTPDNTAQPPAAPATPDTSGTPSAPAGSVTPAAPTPAAPAPDAAPPAVPPAAPATPPAP